MPSRSRLVLPGLLLFALMCAATAAHRSVSTPAQPSSNRRQLKLPLRDPKIIVKKHQRQLALFSDGNIVRTYRVGLGLSPNGDKVRERSTHTGRRLLCFRQEREKRFLSVTWVELPKCQACRTRIARRPNHPRAIRSNPAGPEEQERAAPKHAAGRPDIHSWQRREQRLDMGLRRIGE